MKGVKICAYGMDGFIVPMMKQFAGEGALPNFARMLREGTVNQLAPSFPVWTPTNWATLATGAHTGTHGATRWTVELSPGTRIDSFRGEAVNAERIWNALEREGLTSVVVHYPAAHPSGVESGYVLDGFGHPLFANTEFEVAAAQAYVTDPSVAARESEQRMGHDGTTRTHLPSAIAHIPPLSPATGWTNLPASGSRPLATRLEVRSRIGDQVTDFYVLALDTRGRGYDQVRICRRPDGDACIAVAAPEQWSDWAIVEFPMADRAQRAALRFKLLSLSPDARRLKLYRSQATYTDGFGFPHDISGELVQRLGPYQEHASMEPYTTGMADFDTALEECEYQGLWFADVANYMLREMGCSFFTCHWHLYDYLNHFHLQDVDPACPAYDPKRAGAVLDYFRRAYQVGDRVLGRLWEGVDQDTLVGIVSDHGACPDVRVANIRKFLHESGFLAVTRHVDGVERDHVREADIDWERTTAYLKDDKGFDIYINAPQGSPEFERIERDVLRALRTWVDEEAGRTPVAIALPRRDAYLLGQWGDQCGDIVFAWDHGYVSGYHAQWKGIVGGGTAGAPHVYGGHHGGFIPTQTGISSSFGTLMLAGPGLKRGYERPAGRLGYIHAADVTPTFCHMFGIEPPAQSQGAVAYDLLEGHEMLRDRAAPSAEPG